MSWWRRSRKTEVEISNPPAPERPETDAERIMRWRRHYAEQDRRKAIEQAKQEKADAEEQARRDEAYRDWVAANIARNGVFFPGDAPEELRQGFEQVSGDDPSQSGGEHGPFYGFFRWLR